MTQPPAASPLVSVRNLRKEFPAKTGGTLVAVDPRVHSTGKRYWIDVVVSNDGTVRIDRIVPATEVRNKGAPDGITLQTP